MSRLCWLSVVFLAACAPEGGSVPSDPAAPADADGDGVASPEDCDDEDPTVYPGALELCDGVDNDCDGRVDDEDEIAGTTGTLGFADDDGDGHGDPGESLRACVLPEGFVEDDTDCDDRDADKHPAAPETCDGLDNDCDGLVDDLDEDLDASGGVDAWADADGDGHGDPDRPVRVCAVGHTSGAASTNDDCDDSSREAYPGHPEVCGDGLDNDCSGDASGCGLTQRTTTAEASLTVTAEGAIGAGLGSLTVVLDEDGDGYDDLVVSAPGYRDSDFAPDPKVAVLYGPLGPGSLDIDADANLGVLADFAVATDAQRVGDLDGDGVEDLVLGSGNSLDGGTTWLRQGGTGAVWELLSQRGSTVHALGDLNGDGLDDVAVGTPADQGWYDAIPSSTTGGVHLFFGEEDFFDQPRDSPYGAGVSVVGAYVPGGAWPSWRVGTRGSVATLDANGDGVKDLLLGAPNLGSGAPGRLVVVEGPVSPSWEDQTVLEAADRWWVGSGTAGLLGQSVAAGDLNGDGYDDVVGSEQVIAGATYVFFGEASGAGGHEAWTERDVLITGSEDRGDGHLGVYQAVRDLDEDGDQDLLLMDTRSSYDAQAGAFGFLSLSTSGTLGHDDAAIRLVSPTTAGGCAARAPVFGDLNADGLADLVMPCISEPQGGQVHVFFAELD